VKTKRGVIAPVVYLRNMLHPTPQGQGLYSGLMFTYYMGSAATSFLAPYLNELSLSGAQVGTAIAVINLFGILSAPAAGSISDRLGSPRRVLIGCLAAASILYLCVGLFGSCALFGLPAAVLILPVWSIFKTPLSSLNDSMTVQVVNRKRTFTYGSVRCLGSLGYSIMCIVFGRIAAAMGSNVSVFFLYGILNLIPIALLIRARRDDPPAPQPGTRGRKLPRGGIRLALSSAPFRTFLVVYMLVNVPVYCITTFLPYKLIEISGTSDAFGTLIAIKAFMEVPALLFGARPIQRFGVRSVMICAMSVFLVEQTLYLLAPTTAIVTLALLLHGFTYGLFLSCAIGYIYMITPHEANASAQTLAGALTSVASILGSLAGGFLVDFFGANGYFAFTLCLQVLAIALFLSSLRARRAPNPAASHMQS
jgi:MFS family permease